ncbi:hypothetical protein CERSUDRAFT_148569 [Gelatoporia subvermispora B]|uniref:DH domain-containing protein n=1 Tax=Ceriporiopsis subvermispora (strain B) TaxID=914234 RepID=M2RNT3_CERS8|nr:hypothetical protein CERSUDRAFT_148569 [Gelatoporia subvermispora B]
MSQSPRKLVPLALGDDRPPRPRTKSSGSSITKRVFFCGVVVENAEAGTQIPKDVQDLIISLGEPLDGISDAESSDDEAASEPLPQRKRAFTNNSALADIINEFVSTERTYVTRLRALKYDYARPLRTYTREKSTTIVAPYEVKTLFGNVDKLLKVNEAFLEDLEKIFEPDGPGIGDVALKHFKILKGFEEYRDYYAMREKAQRIYEREMKKSATHGLSTFVEHVKNSSEMRVGLRELLMEPVQRIPRYTLMFRIMIKHMEPDDPQRAALVEADEIASRIAQAETDEQTKRMAIFSSLSANIADFPPAMVSHGRRFIDCIDVEDILVENNAAAGPSSAGATASNSGNLHCTLFLFDDKLMIVKRPGNGEKSGRVISGIEDLEKAAKAGVLNPGAKKVKSGLVCKGVVEVSDLVATDVGGSDMHIYLETPPQDQNDRWSGRQFRIYTAVNPPLNLDPVRTEEDKKRFLDNLWDIQAKYRTRAHQSVALCAEEREVENKGGHVTLARTYFNIYQRTAFLREPKKTKVVLHIDPMGSADPIPFGVHGPPYVVVRVTPMEGELSRYKVASSDPNDEGEDDIVHTARVPARIIQTIHQFGLFKFRTHESRPLTPASTRSRAAIFGLDAISRNLFNARAGHGRGELFGGSINGHRRAKTTSSASRSSTATTTATTDGSLGRLSSHGRSNSSYTAATTVSSVEDDFLASGSVSSSRRSRSMSRTRKLIKKGKSPASEVDTESDASPKRNKLAQQRPSVSDSEWKANDGDVSEWDEDNQQHMRRHGGMDESERDLAMRLELARRNSQNQHGQQQHLPFPKREQFEETIFEEEPKTARPFFRNRMKSRELPNLPPEAQLEHLTTPHSGPDEPLRVPSPYESRSRSRSPGPSERRPMGPRTPSPLPPVRSPQLAPASSDEADLVQVPTLTDQEELPVTPVRQSLLPRSRRLPFDMVGNTDATPESFGTEATTSSRPLSQIEPLLIRKKASVRRSTKNPPAEENGITNSSTTALNGKPTQMPRKASGQNRASRIPKPKNIVSSVLDEHGIRIFKLSQSTKEDVESARRVLRRMKLETEKLRYGSTQVTNPEKPASPASPLKALRTPEQIERPASPLRGLRNSQHHTPPSLTKEAQARMEEMRQLISKRYGEGLSRTRSQSVVASPPRPPTQENSPRGDQIAQAVDDLVEQADKTLSEVLKNHDEAQPALEALQAVTAQLKESAEELQRTQLQLRQAQVKCDALRRLEEHSAAQKEAIFEAFNEELKNIYEQINADGDDGNAWIALVNELTTTKQARNDLHQENINLKKQLLEAGLQRDE